MSVSTEATILVEHDSIESIQDSALALVEWLTKDAAVKVWVTVTDKDKGETHSVLVDVDTLTVVETKPQPGWNEPFIPAVVGDPIFWIVDEQGATFAFDDEALARAQADHERRHDAVNLVLYPVTIPAEVAERGLGAVAEWAASNAAPDEHAEYLTGNAPDIAEQDAADDARRAMTPDEVTERMRTDDPGSTLTDTEALDRIERERPCLDADTTDADLAEWVRITIMPVLEQTGHLPGPRPAAPRFPGLREHLIKQAAGLLEPGEVHHNPEYLRGMVELIIDATRWPDGTDSDTARPAVVAAIEDEVRMQANPNLAELRARVDGLG